MGGEGPSGGLTDVETSDDGTAGQTPHHTMHRHANAELSFVCARARVYVHYVPLCTTKKQKVVSSDDIRRKLNTKQGNSSAAWVSIR